ncbi:hypothetical protein NDU88_001257 [Pleurodeles waltl]|uniref:Uncharacterized protein n=1 Tax=Pleurodeles waltl TaxID=8319 RepID=A0AAV7WNS1_PLEWA|nr:hypothetical protein NDU88_001257 [Pleurodeles waltl]
MTWNQLTRYFCVHSRRHDERHENESRKRLPRVDVHREASVMQFLALEREREVKSSRWYEAYEVMIRCTDSKLSQGKTVSAVKKCRINV